MKKINPLIKLSIGLAAGLLVLIGLSYWFNGRAPSTRKVADEAEQLKAANAKVLANLGAGQVVKVRPIDKEDFVLGTSAAATELIVYLDFDCPFSQQFFPVLKQANDAFGKNLSIAWRHYPLDSHPNAILAAQAFECAREQGQAVPMAQALFDNQAKNDNNTEGILAAVRALGLKEAAFKNCLTSGKYKEKILAQKEEAKLFGVNGTPTSFLNGINLPGAYQFADFSDATGRRYDGLKTLIENELKK